MVNMKKIIIFLVILFLLFGETKVIEPINLSPYENESYAIAGLMYIMPVSDKPEDKEEEKDVVEKCNCDKSTGKISHDGGTSKIDCPCANGESNCGCKHSKKQGDSPSEVSLDQVDLSKYYILKWTATWCGPCKQWDKNEEDKLKKAGIETRKIYEKDRKADFKKFNIGSMPTFWICTKEDTKFYKGYQYEGYNAKKNVNTADFLIKEIKRLDRSLNKSSSVSEASVSCSPSENTVSYTRQSFGTVWSYNGSVRPHRNSLIPHLRNHPEHRNIRDWPFEKLKTEELWWIHWDDHNNKLGKLQWTQ